MFNIEFSRISEITYEVLRKFDLNSLNFQRAKKEKV